MFHRHVENVDVERCRRCRKC